MKKWMKYAGGVLIAAGLAAGAARIAVHPFYIADNRIVIAESVYKQIAPQPIPKLWAHRCDSVEKMKEQLGTFEGVELDLNYMKEAGEFDVSHDMQETLAYPLEDFLAALEGKDVKIWLDFKNLSSDIGGGASRERLDFLFEKYHIDKKRAIVESGNVEALRAFKEDGWYTSYYVPVKEEYLETEEGRAFFVGNVRHAAGTGNVCAVSFPIEYYKLVRESTENIDLLTWDMKARWWTYVWQPERRERLADERLKVILVTSKSRYNR